MIYTITLNPAIDKTVYVPNFTVDEVNRITDIQKDPGGKGINVTKMVKQLKGESVAITVTGGHTGEELLDGLKALEVAYKSIPCQGETRVNTKVVDQERGTFTDINEPGPNIDETILAQIEGFITEEVTDQDILVFAGSIPKGVPTDIYKTWGILAGSKGAKVIIDADGEAFAHGLEANPFLIKPNDDEMALHFNKTFVDEQDLIDHVRTIIDGGVTYVVVSQGSKGCLLVTKESAYKYPPLKVKVLSTVGAGDSMVAAIALGLDQNEGGLTDEAMAKIVALGVASSTASIEREGTIMGDYDRVMEIYDQVQPLKL